MSNALGVFLSLLAAGWAHQGVVLPWDSDEIDYAAAPADAWMVLDLHVSVVLGIALFCWLYGMAVGPWRRRYKWSDKPVESWRIGCFVAGQVVLFCSLNGPLHHLSDYYLFAAHMVQHLLLNLIWAPLTVAALPPWLIEAALGVGWVKILARGTGGLWAKFLIYNGVLYFWHVPFMYDLALAVHNVHIVEHLSFMLTAIIAWMGLIATSPSLPRPPPILQMLYLFGMSLPMKLLGAIITLSDEVIYQGYLPAPRIWGLDPMEDQGWGGLLMWLPGGFSLWACMIVVFARWYKQDLEQKRLEALAWQAAQGLER